MPSSEFRRESGDPQPATGKAYDRFMESMKIDYYKWHDGIGYDLDALNELDSSELKQVEDLLISRKDRDWRDVEALAALNTPGSIQALRDTLTSPNLECRLMAVRYLKDLGIEDHIEEVIVQTLPQTSIGDGMTYALTLAKLYQTENIRRAVLRSAFTGKDDIRVHCAAMALYLYGISKSDFDKDFKIIFEFHEKDFNARKRIFERLCAMVRVNPVDVLF
ncbi:MAG: HEAT repeat domain-containing protein [Chloroflexi bacterium]|nr:HEAT repeat domain-containing protein [Chloroflexota bacterium]BCY17463.1 hypothetical protein hrd7_13120 [Leptolinea sp. HRD-7]